MAGGLFLLAPCQRWVGTRLLSNDQYEYREDADTAYEHRNSHRVVIEQMPSGVKWGQSTTNSHISLSGA
jgi:hypothetical protein